MNFNLISPEGNGHNYNVRFDEPIVIPENATASLNWGQFERDSTIRFSETQTIKINMKKVLPYWDYHNNGDGRISVGGNNIYRKNGQLRNSDDLTFYIEAGNYTLTDLQTKINQKLGTKTIGKGVCSGRVILRDGFDEPIPTNPSLSMYDTDLVIPPKSSDNTFLEFGFIKQNIHAFQPYNATNKLNADIGGGAGLYLNNNATGDGTFQANTGNTNTGNTTWTSYAMGSLDYIHTGTHFNQYTKPLAGVPNVYALKDGGFDELENLNTVLFTPNKVCGELKGDLYVGLYSEAYAGVNDGTGETTLSTQGNTDRTRAGILITKRKGAVTNSSVPQSYFGVRIMGETSCAACDGTGGTAKINGKMALQFFSPHIGTNVAGLSKNITAMTQDALTLDLSSLIAGGNLDGINVAVGFHSYFDRGAKFSYKHGQHKGKLHFRVFVMFNNGAKFVVYDTNTKFPHTAIVADGTDRYGYDQAFMESMAEPKTGDNNAGTLTFAQARASGFPFTPIVASTHQGEGGILNYVGYTNPSSAGDLTNTTNTHLLDYSLSLSKELAQIVVNTNTEFELAEKSASYVDFGGAFDFLSTKYGSINNIQPSQCEFFYRLNSLNSPAAKDKYSIVLNNLPIKGYKNTNDKNKSGYRKPILASIPQPFMNNKPADYSDNIVGSYSASLGIVNRLSNQAMTTNNFDVLILDMETDKPAEQITKSIINFTIHAD